MLVISRKSQEFIQIGDEIVIKIIRTARGSVKIGVEAPGGTRVLRGELCDREIEDLLPSLAAPRRARSAYGAADEALLQPAEAL